MNTSGARGMARLLVVGLNHLPFNHCILNDTSSRKDVKHDKVMRPCYTDTP